MTYLIAGFLLGVAGTVHCLGMCGPLVLFSSARPAEGAAAQGSRRPAHWRRFVAHHASRVAAYAVLGAVVGFAGAAVAEAGWRNWLAIAAGAVLIAQAIGLGGRLVNATPARRLTTLISGAARFLPRSGLGRSIGLGVLNGMMPCGLLYAALAAAAGLGQPRAAIGFMVAFALGSVPAFAVLVYSAHALIPRLPRRLRQAAPIALALVGIMLIARGLPIRGGHDAAPHSMTLTHRH